MISVSKLTVFEVTTRRGRERAREIWTGMQVTGLSVEDLGAAKRAGCEPGEGSEWFVGRDPREMARAELEAMGHEAMSATEAIRAKCLDSLCRLHARGAKLLGDSMPVMAVANGDQSLAATDVGRAARGQTPGGHQKGLRSAPTKCCTCFGRRVPFRRTGIGSDALSPKT